MNMTFCAESGGGPGEASSPQTETRKTSASPNPYFTSRSYVEKIRRNSAANRSLMVVTLTYTLSWLGWNVFNIAADFLPIEDYDPQTVYLTFALCHAVAMSSATTNSVMYGWMNRNIRSEIVKLLISLRIINGRKQATGVVTTTCGGGGGAASRDLQASPAAGSVGGGGGGPLSGSARRKWAMHNVRV